MADDRFDVLRQYIRTEIGYDGEVGPDVDLLETGVLDSFSIVQMAVFIQERFEIELDADDLVRANLSKLSAMVSMIERKVASA
jgi:acyl carrier protein